MLATAPAVELLETLLLVGEAEGGACPARRDWFVCIVLDALALCGGTLEAPTSSPSSSRRCAATPPRPLRVAAPLLPFGAATADDDVEEPFDAMWALVTALAEGGWSSTHLLAPHRAFEKKLDEAPQHPLPLVTIPPHERGCTPVAPPPPPPPPAARRRRADAGVGGAAAAEGVAAGGGGEDGGGGGGGGGARRRSASRSACCSSVAMVAHAFVDSHKHDEAARVDTGAQPLPPAANLAAPRPP